jgi:hypothetical protein
LRIKGDEKKKRTMERKGKRGTKDNKKIKGKRRIGRKEGKKTCCYSKIKDSDLLLIGFFTNRIINGQ